MGLNEGETLYVRGGSLHSFPLNLNIYFKGCPLHWGMLSLNDGKNSNSSLLKRWKNSNEFK